MDVSIVIVWTYCVLVKVNTEQSEHEHEHTYLIKVSGEHDGPVFMEDICVCKYLPYVHSTQYTPSAFFLSDESKLDAELVELYEIMREK